MPKSVLTGDCVKAADDLTADLRISHSLWIEACAVLGKRVAAVCVVLIEHTMLWRDNLVCKPTPLCSTGAGKGDVGAQGEGIRNRLMEG